MKQQYHTILRLIVLSLLLACNKDKIELTCKERAVKKQTRQCNDLGEDCLLMLDHQIKTPYFSKPCFNPSNLDEFICVQHNENATMLIKYNLASLEKTVLVENLDIASRPVWGRSGWIVFHSFEWKVWKVKDDGTGLKQITFAPKDIHPAFNFEGNKIIFSRSYEFTNEEIEENPALQNRNKMMIIDVDGNLVDSICVLAAGFCKNWDVSAWGLNDEILHVAGNTENYGISFYDYQNLKEGDQYFGYPYSGNSISNIQWHSPFETSIYFMNSEGLQMYNMSKESIQFIRKSCEQQYYRDFSISGDGTKIIVMRADAVLTGPCEVTTVNSIVIMNSDGCDEQIIDIPE